MSLTKLVARDGEGATKLIEVHVDRARDDAQAKRVAKAIVNSPLVKTAVHGADPNWGRVAMAVGKCSDETDIDEEHVVIRFGDQEVYPTPVDDAGLERARGLHARRHEVIHCRSASPRDGHRVGLRPHRRLRPHQRRLHDLTRTVPTGLRSPHFGGIRMPPSTRMVSAFM